MAELQHHFLDPHFFCFEITSKGLTIMGRQTLKSDSPVFKNARRMLP